MKKISLFLFFSICSLSSTLYPFLMKIEDGKVVNCVPNTLPAMRAGGTSLNILPVGYIIPASGKYFIGDAPPAFTAGVTPITIAASDVELDLNGFTITGPGGMVGTDAGITATDVSNVVIKNGTIELINGNGIELLDCTSVRIENVVCRQNGNNGFDVQTIGNEHCSLIDCRAEGNGDNGFADAGGSTISYQNCVSYSNGSNMVANQNHGFNMSANNHLLEDCTSNENDGLGLSVTGTAIDILSCHFDENDIGGIEVEQMNDFCIQDCTFNRNSGTGLLFTSASDGSVRRCCIIGNMGDGIHAQGTVLVPSDQISICDNAIINNTDKGVTLDVSTTQSCQVIANKVVGNGSGQGGDGFGIDIGGSIFVAGAAGATPRSHEVFGNFTKNNGTNPADKNAANTDTNYSNDVQASPNGVPAAPNGLVTTPAAGAGRLQNITT